jgi:hypothetical protein
MDLKQSAGLKTTSLAELKYPKAGIQNIKRGKWLSRALNKTKHKISSLWPYKYFSGPMG